MIKEDFVRQPSLRLKQDYDRYTMTSDTLHLASFMKIRKQDDVLDVGTNNGVLALIASFYTQKKVVGIDIEASAIHLSSENAQINQRNCEFIQCPVQAYLGQNALDVILCNPPYFKKNFAEQNEMDFDGTLTLDDLALASFNLLKDKGRLYIILKTHRMSEAIILFEKHELIVKRIQMIHHSALHPASSVCMEFKKRAKEHLIVDAPILNHKEDEK